jgi:large subunit ribosomal protein L9
VGVLCSGVPVVLQVILLNDIEKLGKQGELLTVPIGYWRNFLLPQGQAKVASQDILE